MCRIWGKNANKNLRANYNTNNTNWNKNDNLIKAWSRNVCEILNRNANKILGGNENEILSGILTRNVRKSGNSILYRSASWNVGKRLEKESKKNF